MNSGYTINPPDPFRGCQRQVHLDFHNSPFIPDVGAEFDASSLAKKFKQADVNSVVVFAKCVHGMCYYPSNVGRRHPALDSRDLMGEFIEALHREGIRAPIYTIIAWEENLATEHPEWMQMTAEGTFAQLATSSDNKTPQPGRFHFLNFLHPDYQDYFEAHLLELLTNYPVDGLFLDMLVVHPEACWSDPAIAFREKHGLTGADRATHARFETAAQLAFAQRFTPLIKAHHPTAAIFYNSENRIFTDSALGVRARAPWQTHTEVESLPTGFWGYHHFPRVARAVWLDQKPWLGMTGRFQRMWGDFGGIKPQAALEFECFRSQAMGGANSVGDQLHPRGKLDEAAYQLIGNVYKQCHQAEDFYRGSTAIPQIGLIAPLAAGTDENKSAESEEGAVILCQESHYDCTLLTDDADLAPYQLVILPDCVELTPALREKLIAYHADGGIVMASYLSAFDTRQKPALPFMPVEWKGHATRWPNYWRTRPLLMNDLDRDDRVFYLRGANVRRPDNSEVWIERVLPYFQRSDLQFTSHFQAPPLQAACEHPAVIAGPRWVYFSDPIFRELRRHGNIFVKAVWQAVVSKLIGPTPFGAGLKSTIRLYPRRRKEDLILTLLHYVAKRKTAEMDVIEERMSFAGQFLRLPSNVNYASVYGDTAGLPKTREGFALPSQEGRLLVEVPGFFSMQRD